MPRSAGVFFGCNMTSMVGVDPTMILGYGVMKTLPVLEKGALKLDAKANCIDDVMCDISNQLRHCRRTSESS